MAPPSASSSWKRLAVAFAVVAVGLGAGFFVWRSNPGAEANVVLIDAIEEQTGLLLSAEGALLDPASGMWRAEQVALRTSPNAEPALTARKVELKLSIAELVRGQVRIERASLYGSVLTLDLRPKAAGAPAIDRARLARWFPFAADVPEATVVLKAAGFDLRVQGLALGLTRDGDALRGRLIGNAARASIGDGEPLPLKTEAEVAWTASGLALDAIRATVGSSTLRGALELGSVVALTLAGDAVALEDLGPLLPAELSGRGRVELRIADREPTMSLALERARVREQAFDRLKGDVQAEPGAIVVRAFEAQRGAERYRADVLRFDADFAPSGTIHVDALALADAFERAGVALTAGGTASGELTLDEGSVRAVLELSAPAFGAYRFDGGKLDARVASLTAAHPALEIAALELRSKLASLTVSGKADGAGVLTLDGKARTALGGRELDIDVSVRGTAHKPETTLELAGVEAARAGYALRAELSGKELVRGSLELTNADFSEHLPVIEHAGAPRGRIDARIELTRGALDDLRALEGRGEIKKLAFGYGDARFESTAPFSIALQGGRVQLGDVALKSGDTRWTMRGELDLERGVDLTASSELPLAPLLASVPFVGSVEGNVGVSLAVRGKGQALALTGEARPRDVALAVGPLKTPWTQLSGRVSLEGRALYFHDVTGSFGTGTLSLSGALTLTGIKAKTADLKLRLRDFELSPQPRFDIALEADGTLKWSAGDALPVLGGAVTLTRMHYARHVQLPEAVIALGKKSKDAGEPTVAIDVMVGHRAPLTVRNDFLDVELEMTGRDKLIRVAGTDAQLGALGELSVLRGRALFRGATLTVRRGVITFKSHKSIAPSLDLLADAPAKRRPGGLIHFAAHGDPKRFELTLRCEATGAVPPPFSCAYAGDEMTCGNFDALTALWACQP